MPAHPVSLLIHVLDEPGHDYTALHGCAWLSLMVTEQRFFTARHLVIGSDFVCTLLLPQTQQRPENASPAVAGELLILA
jgi:hypothetical protein